MGTIFQSGKFNGDQYVNYPNINKKDRGGGRRDDKEEQEKGGRCDSQEEVDKAMVAEGDPLSHSKPNLYYKIGHCLSYIFMVKGVAV